MHDDLWLFELPFGRYCDGNLFSSSQRGYFNARKVSSHAKKSAAASNTTVQYSIVEEYIDQRSFFTDFLPTKNVVGTTTHNLQFYMRVPVQSFDYYYDIIRCLA
jgi:hypothetical protein